MGSRERLMVEGQTIELSEHLARAHTARDPYMSFELSECKRKLANREADLKRKEKECSKYQSESIKWQQEHDLTKTEVVSIRERNEQLQLSLLGARSTVTTQNFKLKDYEESTKITEKLKKTEAALSRVNEKARSIEIEVEELRKPSVEADKAMRRLEVLLRLSKQSEDKLKTEAMALQLSMDKCEEEKEKNEKEIDDLRKRLVNSQNLSDTYDKDLTKMRSLLLEKDRIFANLSEDVNKLQADLQIKAESNFTLRGQLAESDEKNLRSEKFLALEAKHLKLLQKSNELTVTVEGHSDSLRLMDDTRINLKTQLDTANKLLATKTEEIESLKSKILAERLEMKILRKESGKLRTNNQGLRGSGQQDITNLSAYNEREMGALQKLLVTTMREKQLALDSIINEKKLRKIAEDDVRSQQVRISFLSEQLEQMSNLKSSWSERETILKTEIHALIKLNKNFRRQLLDQSNINENENDLNNISNDGITNVIGISGPESTDAIFKECRDRNMDPYKTLNLNSTLGEENSKLESLTDTAERVIERTMFDLICAFSSRLGSSSILTNICRDTSISNTTDRNRGKNSNPGVYGINQCENGFYELIYTDENDGKGNEDSLKYKYKYRYRRNIRNENNNDNDNINDNNDESIDGYELLNDLKLPFFLESCQKNGMKVMPISAMLDKLVFILNYFRVNTKEKDQKLCDSRMENAMLLSHIHNFKLQSDSSKILYTKERLSKQVKKIINASS